MSWELTGNSGTNPNSNFLGTIDKQPLAIKTNGAEHLRVDENGNVGIGTLNPQTKLEISSGFDTEVLRFGYSTIDYHSISTSFHGETPSHNYLGFNVEHNSSDVRRVLTLQGDGNVGIGVNNPGMALDVQGRTRLRDGIGGPAAGTAGLWFNTANVFASDGIADIGFIGAIDPTRIGLYGNDPRGGSHWGFTFDTVTGNVGIGTGTDYPTDKLQVNGVILAQGVRFPDGSFQTTANLQGPPGQDGRPGPQGPTGPQGNPGAPGAPGAPGVRTTTSALCGPSSCNFVCGSGLVAEQIGPCFITSDTGSCQATQGAFCCVCHA